MVRMSIVITMVNGEKNEVLRLVLESTVYINIS